MDDVEAILREVESRAQPEPESELLSGMSDGIMRNLEDEDNMELPKDLDIPNSDIPNPGIFGPEPVTVRPHDGLGMGYGHVF
jgi:hypothetical protein